ncbi:MAG: hypothetical protein AAGA03_08920 [Planctomycetota bacterium]
MQQKMSTDKTPDWRDHPVGSEAFLAARRAAMAEQVWPVEDPSYAPVGHERGIRTSTRITSNYRGTHRKRSMDVKPEEVIDVLKHAQVTRWVLMGLHGYVGYLSDPRATQDVDVLIDHDFKHQAVKAIQLRWPQLETREADVAVRFHDPGDVDADGKPKPVIDLMLPWSNIHAEILKYHVIVDPETGHHLPNLEAALCAKYAAMVSPHRAFDRKSQDAVDFRLIVKCNLNDIDRERLQTLAEFVWTGAGPEILEFLDLAVNDQPFPL